MDFHHIPLLLFRFPKLSFFKCADKKYFLRRISSKINSGFTSIQHNTNSTTTGDDCSSTNSCNYQWWDRFLSTNDANIFQTLKTDLVVYENFISVEEEKSLLNEVEPYLKRLRYEHDHWDDVSSFSLP